MWPGESLSSRAARILKRKRSGGENYRSFGDEQALRFSLFGPVKSPGLSHVNTI